MVLDSHGSRCYAVQSADRGYLGIFVYQGLPITSKILLVLSDALLRFSCEYAVHEAGGPIIGEDSAVNGELHEITSCLQNCSRAVHMGSRLHLKSTTNR